MSGRGSTRLGRPAPVPEGTYEPPSAVRYEHAELSVDFHGEDGRHATFRVDPLPLPGWHQPLAEAWATRIGPSGQRRTLASARAAWGAVERFLRFLDTHPSPPTEPSQLRAAHIEDFLAYRALTMHHAYAAREVHAVAAVLRLPPLHAVIPRAAMEAASRRWSNSRGPSKPGYSHRELARLLTTARRDVARIRDRILCGEQLITNHAADPGTARSSGSADAELLASIAATGMVPGAGLWFPQAIRARREQAARLFLTIADLTPLLVLLVAVTGRNVETIKELPVEHRILDGRAVELRLTKRRRGATRWIETVTWEIGPAHRELHTPGGLYLLLHRLAERGREFSGATRVWSIWRNGHRARVSGIEEHVDPFARDLRGQRHYLRDWTAGQELTADAVVDGVAPARFNLDFNRLKTSIEVRRTRQLGGHLPSAARSNSAAVLFTNYLRGDPITIDWAQEIVSEAVVDAERAALSAHRQALAVAGGSLQITPGPPGERASSGEQTAPAGRDAAWSSCTDSLRHPVTGTLCRSSFLDCFHCGNCLITPTHLPRVLALFDALAARRQHLSEHEWWSRYGPVWCAIRYDVLPKFSPAELEYATVDKPADALLDLVEEPWEHP